MKSIYININNNKQISFYKTLRGSYGIVDRQITLMWRLWFTDKQNIQYFLATPWRICATHKCVATPGLRTTALDHGSTPKNAFNNFSNQILQRWTAKRRPIPKALKIADSKMSADTDTKISVETDTETDNFRALVIKSIFCSLRSFLVPVKVKVDSYDQPCTNKLVRFW